MKFFIYPLLFILATSSAAFSSSGDLAPISDRLLWIAGTSSSYNLKNGIKRVNSCFESPVDSDLCNLAFELKNSPYQKPDISPLLFSSFVYVGERHITSHARRFIINHLQQLRDNGFTTLAMEMWNYSAQADLDKHINNQFNLTWIQENFPKHWAYDPQTYFEMMTEAHRLGFKILALDSRDKFDTSKMTFAGGLLARDQEMAEILAKELKKQPTQKIIVLTGKLHAYSHVADNHEQPSQPEILAQKTGASISTVSIINKAEVSPFSFVINVLELSNTLIKTQPALHFTDYLYVQD